MKLAGILALVCLIGASMAVRDPVPSNLEDYQTYLRYFNKDESTRSDVSEMIFTDNIAAIKEHNEKFEEGKVTFLKGINQFTDMSEKEIQDYIRGLPEVNHQVRSQWPTDHKFAQTLKSGASNAPDSVNWVEKGAVTSVKDQGQCGSCAAFATAAAVESCFYQATGTHQDVSEQFLLDCGKGHSFGNYGAYGCDGAFPQAYFDFLATKTGGKIQTESAYGYTARDGSCHSSQSGWYKSSVMSSWKNVWSPDEETIVKQWVSEIGPVSTSVYVGNDFASYAGGVLNARDCCNQKTNSHCSDKNNHAVTIVGYGVDSKSGLKYWLVKNSWSPRWGEQGYLRIMRGTGHCGIFGQMAVGPTKCTATSAHHMERSENRERSSIGSSNNNGNRNHNNRNDNNERSEWKWESGKEYVYDYSGRLLTGIPELNDVYSGVGINCTVHIQRVPRYEGPEESTFTLSIKDPKYVRINDKLEPEFSSGGSDVNWRELRLPQFTEVSGEYHNILTKPIMFSVTNGEIHSAKISRDEPVWSVNFKKALALQFQTKWDVSQVEEVMEHQQRNHRLREESSDEDLTYWKVKEETIDGVCEHIYEVRELPKYMIVDRPEMVPYPEACPEEKYYGLTKTKDVAKCEKKSTFNYFGTGRFDYELSGNNMNMWSRSSSTRYIACGSRGNLVIQTIINDGELNQNLLGYKTERFVTGTMQVFRLKEVRSASNVEMPRDTVTLKSMMYEYSTESFVQQVDSPLKKNLSQEERRKIVESGRIPESLVNNPEVLRQAMPRTFLYGVKPSDISSQEIMTQLKKYLSEIVRELTEGVDTKEKQITAKVMAVSRGFLMLKSKDEIAAVYEQLKSEFSSRPEDLESLKNIFFDTLLMSGCPKCILFIKESIMSGELSTAQISSFFIWMPTYVKVPTEEVLKSLYELSTCDKIRQSDILYNKAIMGFSTLLNKACISSFRSTRYPINVFGEFCNPDSEIVVSKWIPYLVHDLKYNKSYQKRNELIVSLGLLEHTSVIAELIPFVEGSAEDTTKLNRYLAIYSLSSVTESGDSTQVFPILFSILSNPAECSTLRIAAFNALLKINPSMTVMHKIASLTWTIKDEELLKVINIAFFTLSKETEIDTYDQTRMSLPKKAFLVYPLIKKTEGILPSSATIFTGDDLREMGVGYSKITAWTAGKSSFIPNDFYTELNYFMDTLRVTPFSLGLHLTGAENLYKQVEKLFERSQSGDEDDEEERRDEVSQEWEKIIQELQLKVREGEPLDAAFFVQWFESSPMFYNFDKMSPKQLREMIAPLLSNPDLIKEKLCGDFPLNFQQTLDRTPTVFMIPSDMGFPIVIEVHMPVALSVRGSLNVQCSLTPSINLKASVVANSQYSGWVGTTIPFTKEYTVTGVQEQFVLNIPAKMEMKLDIPSSQVSISFKPETGSTSRPMDFLHFDVKPFITYKKVSDLTPLTLTPNVKYISSGDEVKKQEYSFGDYFGLNLKSKVETESPYTDFKSFLDIMELYNNNPLNALRFLWTSPALTEEGKPSLRSHEYCLTYDPSSPTKEVQFDFKIGYGQKVEGEQIIKYHKLSVNNRHHESRRRNSPLNLSPFKVDSDDIDSHSEHPRRQEKVKQALNKLNVETGSAVTIVSTTTLKGSRPRSWSYILTVAAGKESPSSTHGLIKSKWDIHLESETSACPIKEICIKGEVDLPVLPIWNTEELHTSLVDFRYVNEIRFGKSSCSESSIKVTGTAKVSRDQKEFSRKSDDAKECRKLMEERVAGAKLSDVCERVRLDAQTVDEVDFKLDYVNVPKEVTSAQAKVIDYLKMYLWPYLKMSESHVNRRILNEESESSFSDTVRIVFDSETPSFDLTINRPEEGSIVFSQIRIPYPLDQIFPLRAGRNNAYLALKSIAGPTSFTPECKIGKESLTTFDNTTLPLTMDDCFHLLSGDCSKDRTFGIFARDMKHESNLRRELKVFLGDVTLVLTPSERRNDPYFADVRITVDSEELTLPANTWRSIQVRGQDYGSLFRSSDNVFQLKSDKYFAHFMFDGQRVVVYASNLLKGDKLCGVCGNFNQQSLDDMTGPSQCVHSRPETFIASYRIPSRICGPMPQDIKRELEQVKRKCVKVEEIPTKITESLKAQSGKCSQHKHVVVERQGQVCISKSVVTECQSTCKVAEGKMVTKTVPFICLPQGRAADLYVQKANNGEQLPQLRRMETSFESQIEQPKQCVSSIVKGPAL